MEPERHIEKLLRAYAKKRRNDPGAASELHPATRRLLQGEVARRAAKPGKERSWLDFLTALRPRMALVLCLAGLVLVGVFLWPGLSPSKTKSQLAYQPAKELAAPPPAEAPSITFSEGAVPAREVETKATSADLGVREEREYGAKTPGREEAAKDKLAADNQPAPETVGVVNGVIARGVSAIFRHENRCRPASIRRIGPKPAFHECRERVGPDRERDEPGRGT